MENPLKSLKRAPRWVWITTAGVGIGAGVIKLWNDRGAEPVEGEGEGVGGEVGTLPGAPVGSAPGIVVPPIIMPPQSDQAPYGIDLLTGVVGDLSAGWEALLGPIVSNQAAINSEVISAIAGAGGPPGMAQGNPTPVSVVGPVSVIPAKPPAAPDPCRGRYPHQDKDGPNKGRCFYTSVTTRTVGKGTKADPYECVKQNVAHYKGGGTEYKSVISRRKGKC